MAIRQTINTSCKIIMSLLTASVALMAFLVIDLMQVVQCLNRTFESVLSESAFRCNNSLHVCLYQTWLWVRHGHLMGSAIWWVGSRICNRLRMTECRMASVGLGRIVILPIFKL